MKLWLITFLVVLSPNTTLFGQCVDDLAGSGDLVNLEVRFDAIEHTEGQAGTNASALRAAGLLADVEEISFLKNSVSQGHYPDSDTFLGAALELGKLVQGATYLQILIRWSKILAEDLNVEAGELFLAFTNNPSTQFELSGQRIIAKEKVSSRVLLSRQTMTVFPPIYDLLSMIDQGSSLPDTEHSISNLFFTAMTSATWYLRGHAQLLEGFLENLSGGCTLFGNVSKKVSKPTFYSFRLTRPDFVTGEGFIELRVEWGRPADMPAMIIPRLPDSSGIPAETSMARLTVDGDMAGGLYSVSAEAAEPLLLSMGTYERTLLSCLRSAGAHEFAQQAISLIAPPTT